MKLLQEMGHETSMKAPRFYSTSAFIAVFIKSRHWKVSRCSLQLISTRSVLILSSGTWATVYGRRWKDNIKTDLTEIGFEDMVWIYLVQDRERRLALVKMVMNLRIP